MSLRFFKYSFLELLFGLETRTVFCAGTIYVIMWTEYKSVYYYLTSHLYNTTYKGFTLWFGHYHIAHPLHPDEIAAYILYHL